MGWLYHARKNCGLLTVIVLGVKVIRGAAVMVSLTNVMVARITEKPHCWAYPREVSRKFN